MSDEKPADNKPMIQGALLNAMRAICKLGISKTSKASAGGANYNYRGIDAAMNEMSPILVNAGITVTPRYSELVVNEMARGAATDGKYRRVVTLKGSFTFSAEDGSSVTAEAYGESVDTADKAVIKAQTVAFRTVLFQQFIVPLMSMDSELDGHDHGEPSAPPDEAQTAAFEGVAAYQKYFGALSKEAKRALLPFHDQLKAAAVEADSNARH